MADQFGLTDDMYLSDDQRGLAADLSRAFDNSREIQERTMARYGIPALSNYERDWAIERARTMADRTNRQRMARSRTGATGSGGGGSLGGGGGSGRGGSNRGDGGYGGYGGSGLGNYGLGGRYPTTQPRVNGGTGNGGRNTIGGIMQLLPLLLGRNGYNELLRDGVIKYVRDAWGNVTAQPGENYGSWLENNSFTTAEGNTAILGEDGQLRIVDPRTGELLENVSADWIRDANGDIDFNSSVFAPDAGEYMNTFEQDVINYNNGTYTPPSEDYGSSTEDWGSGGGDLFDWWG